jgi:hypothetical protein
MTPEALVVVDDYWTAPTIDLEVGMLLHLPPETVSMEHTLMRVRDTPSGILFQAAHAGIGRVARPDTKWAAFVRVSRNQYVGLARYRHLEDPSDD